jgi:uncharacterized protein (TIGR02996 family)
MIAAPDDDAPRLVWADREGGARGELVVVQCALAARDLPREERKRLRQRERELLEANERRWAELDDDVSAKFVRGFVEEVAIRLRRFGNVEDLLARAPLLRSIEIVPEWGCIDLGASLERAWAEDAELYTRGFAALPSGRITSFAAWPTINEAGDQGSGRSYSFANRLVEIVREAPALAALESLAIYGDEIDAARLAPLVRLARLAAMFGDGAAGAVAALRALPRLSRLEINNALGIDSLLAAPEIARLVELGIYCNDGLARRIAAMPSLANLEILDLGPAWTTGISHAGLASLAAAPFAPRLRALGLAGAKLTVESVDVLLSAFPALERLHVPDRTPRIDALRAVIPEVET